MCRIPVLVLLFTMLFGCGEDDLLDPVEVSAGLLFVGTDATFSSSGLFFMDLEKYKISKILDGESGDFVVRKDSGRIFLFNRKPGNLNFRELVATKKEDGSVVFEAGKQRSIEGASDYDPHGVLVLDDKYLLLANYAGKNVRVINIDDGKIKQKLAVDWDTDTSEGIKAESFYRISADSIYVSHQGVDSSGLTVNDSQSVFRLKWEDETLSEVDMDNSADLVQGKALKGTFPGGFHKLNSGGLMVVGLCSDYFAKTCKSGVDEIAVNENAVTPRADLDLSDYLQNGSFVQSATDRVFYGNVQTKKDDVLTSKVVKFDLGQTFSATEIHKFGKDGSENGFWPSFYAVGKGQLIVTEKVDGESGQFLIFENDEKIKTIQVEAIPSAGIFVTDGELD